MTFQYLLKSKIFQAGDALFQPTSDQLAALIQSEGIFNKAQLFRIPKIYAISQFYCKIKSSLFSVNILFVHSLVQLCNITNIKFINITIS